MFAGRQSLCQSSLFIQMDGRRRNGGNEIVWSKGGQLLMKIGGAEFLSDTISKKKLFVILLNVYFAQIQK